MRFDYWELVKAFNFEGGGDVDFFFYRTLKLRSVRGNFCVCVRDCNGLECVVSRCGLGVWRWGFELLVALSA